MSEHAALQSLIARMRKQGVTEQKIKQVLRAQLYQARRKNNRRGLLS